MSLDEIAKAWVRDYSNRYPWVGDIIKKYGLDLSLYNFNKELPTSLRYDMRDRARFIEDICFLKTFDEHVMKRLPPNFSTVLEIGVGNWTYAFALATFFQHYNSQAFILGIDNDPSYVEEARASIQDRNINGVGAVLGDITYWSGKHDVVVNICSNLTSDGNVYGARGLTHAKDFFYNIWRGVSEEGLFVMGLGYTSASETDALRFLAPFFKNIVSNINPYLTNKSTYPMELLITAKPKLPIELTQS